jgi:hypothetical protein
MPLTCPRRAPGTDVALDQSGVGLAKSASAPSARLDGRDLALESLEVDLAVAGQSDGQRLAGPSGCLSITTTFFRVSAARPVADPAWGRSGVEDRSTSVSMVGVSGCQRRAAGRSSYGHRGGRRAWPPPRRWRRSRSCAPHERVLTDRRRSPGTPRWPSRPSPRTWPSRSRSRSRAGRRSGRRHPVRV